MKNLKSPKTRKEFIKIIDSYMQYMVHDKEQKRRRIVSNKG